MSVPSTPQGRPPAFSYRRQRAKSSSLHCEQVALERLAAKFGTPLYVYSGATIRDRFRAFDAAFGDIPHTVCYSVKANSNLHILRMLSRLGSGFDVVSGGELERVLRVERRAAKRVVFSGVGKTADEMDLALRTGILMFNLESESEAEVLAQRAARLRKRARVALRVNPDVSAQTHPYISTGLHQHKFGIPIAESSRIYRQLAGSRHLQPVGISVHIGSQITSVEPFSEAMARVSELAKELNAAGLDIRYIDAGGGLGICYQTANLAGFPQRAREYAQAVLAPLTSLGVHLLLEPGRAIVGPAGVLLTRVLYRKHNDSKNFLVVDAAMNDLIRPSLYNAHHDIVPVHLEQNSSAPQKFDVVGPICETGDFFARDRDLPSLGEGDLLAILDAGAYGMSISSNYNSRPRAAEVLVEGKKNRLIRRREKIADLWRNETL